jgi:UDP-N-acetylglucosamine 3-dehydrogenase
MRRLGVAVIGVGAWGTNHVRVFRDLADAELVAVCDVNAERAKAVARQFGGQFYTDLTELLRNDRVEAVTVCTWATKLAETSMNVLRAGKHLLVEKPMAGTVEQAEAVLRLAEKENLVLTVGFLTRFIPGVARIKQAIESKEIGEIVCATAKRVSPWPERIGDVGVVKDLTIHDIDIIRHLFGEEPKAVSARTGNIIHERLEDYAQAMLFFKQKSAFLETNWLTPYKVRQLTVTGSKAIMRLDYITQELTRDTATESIHPRLEFQEPLKLELEHFVNCVLNGKTPLVTGSDGVKALKIASGILASSATGKIVPL